MSKMHGKNKKFGRCNVEGHGDCSVTREAQSSPVSKASEKEQWLKEAKELLKND